MNKAQSQLAPHTKKGNHFLFPLRDNLIHTNVLLCFCSNSKPLIKVTGIMQFFLLLVVEVVSLLLNGNLYKTVFDINVYKL